MVCSVFILFVYSQQLAGTNRPIALAQANATLSRIDLICEVITEKYDLFVIPAYS